MTIFFFKTCPTFCSAVNLMIQVICELELASVMSVSVNSNLHGQFLTSAHPGMKNVRTGIRITSYGLTKCLPDVRNRLCLCTFLSLQNDLINWFNVSRLFIFLTNILFIIRFVLIVLLFQYRLTIFASLSGIL